ncbi:AraC family transcriptional regulator [Microvirga mediterraneensis]|uniref:AraC family transcriptional regulator n=1 Tax=Microvirga mediterraneensis TaxID=2754695 RepID=A0A838BV27_9HYPH|nr:AraC family transcriptional regulator [Microvirga mediterraneensis]MBA1158743.1 AraC family transcriptional regulator [Microvirga mediterraneensis]
MESMQVLDVAAPVGIFVHQGREIIPGDNDGRVRSPNDCDGYIVMDLPGIAGQRNYPLARPHLVDDPYVLRAVDHVEQALSEPLTLNDVAAKAGLSPFHFHRRFAASMGETIGDYIRIARLSLAASLIARSETAILEAALRTGYGSQAAFTRAFGKQFEHTPKNLRALVLERAPSPTALHRDFAGAASLQVQPGTPLIGMRFHGGYDQVLTHWRHFARYLLRTGFNLDRAQAVGVLYDDPGITPANRIRYDCCMIDAGWPDHFIESPLRRLNLQVGAYAQVKVDGEYRLVSESIFSLCVLWLQRHRRGLGNGLAYEIYSAPPWTGSGDISATVLVPIL